MSCPCLGNRILLDKCPHPLQKCLLRQTLILEGSIRLKSYPIPQNYQNRHYVQGDQSQ